MTHSRKRGADSPSTASAGSGVRRSTTFGSVMFYCIFFFIIFFCVFFFFVCDFFLVLSETKRKCIQAGGQLTFFYFFCGFPLVQTRVKKALQRSQTSQGPAFGGTGEVRRGLGSTVWLSKSLARLYRSVYSRAWQCQ